MVAGTANVDVVAEGNLRVHSRAVSPRPDVLELDVGEVAEVGDDPERVTVLDGMVCLGERALRDDCPVVGTDGGEHLGVMELAVLAKERYRAEYGGEIEILFLECGHYRFVVFCSHVVLSLLSYAVGCMLGRYSLDEEGLAFAGGTFDSHKYTKLEVDEDGILPILSGTWFEDDIIEELKRFLKAAFGEMYFSENMEYIADTLGRKSGESAESTIKNYFFNKLKF